MMLKVYVVIFLLMSLGQSAQAYEVVKIPKGSFTLHIPLTNSRTKEFVTKKYSFAKPFYMGKYQVTNEMWSECHKAGACTRAPKIEPGEMSNHPIARVNWHDAQQFVRWYSKKTKKKFRLPTEAEWAYAMYEGQDHKEISLDYDYKDVSINNNPIKRTLPIGTINQNAWGIYDFKGNVWEWTLTCWYASKGNILKDRSIEEMSSTDSCTTRIALGETRAHIPDFISTTYNGGCSSLKPAANIGFRMIQEI